jgi:hypothetical protein
VSKKKIELEPCDGPSPRGSRDPEKFDLLLDGARGGRGQWLRVRWEDLGFTSSNSLSKRVADALEKRMDPDEVCDTAVRGEYIYLRVFRG